MQDIWNAGQFSPYEKHCRNSSIPQKSKNRATIRPSMSLLASSQKMQKHLFKMAYKYFYIHTHKYTHTQPTFMVNIQHNSQHNLALLVKDSRVKYELVLYMYKGILIIHTEG